MSDILTYLDEAIDALTVGGMERHDVRTGDVTEEADIPIGQRSLQIECDRLDRALRFKEPTMIGVIGESITQALIAIEAARNELRGKK